MTEYGFFIVEGDGAKAVVWARDVQQAREAAISMSHRFRRGHAHKTPDPTGQRQAHVLMSATEDEAGEWGLRTEGDQHEHGGAHTTLVGEQPHAVIGAQDAHEVPGERA